MPQAQTTRWRSRIWSAVIHEQVQYTPTSAATLGSHVATDIDLNMMIAAGTYERYGGSHFNSHPNLTIYHWTTIRGYEFGFDARLPGLRRQHDGPRECLGKRATVLLDELDEWLELHDATTA